MAEDALLAWAELHSASPRKSPVANFIVRMRGFVFPWCSGSESNRHDPKVEGF